MMASNFWMEGARLFLDGFVGEVSFVEEILQQDVEAVKDEDGGIGILT